MDRANGKPGFNPRLLPPLIGLGLLLLIVLAVLFSRGGQQRTAEELDARVVRKVAQTPDFTFLEVEDEGGPFWLAAPRVDVQVGDRVRFDSAREARDFPAPSLKRTFERLLLVGQLFKIDADGRAVALESTGDSHGRDLMESAHGGIPGHGGLPGHGSSGAGVKSPKLEKAEGGQAIAEIAGDLSKHSGQTVKVRGMIVRARQRVRPGPGLPATNWYRLQDGSGAEPLLFTSDEVLAEDDVVTIAGKLTTDKDFGGGLSYKMIIEGPTITREKAGAPTKSEAPKSEASKPNVQKSEAQKPAARSTKSETNPKHE